jgi:hypothetical protein
MYTDSSNYYYFKNQETINYVTNDNNNNDTHMLIIDMIKNIGLDCCYTDIFEDESTTKIEPIKPIQPIEKTTKIEPIETNYVPFVIPARVLMGYNNYYKEYAQDDIELEEMCSKGDNCPFKKNPLKCPLNHHSMPKIIKQNEIIPNLFCRYERKWKLLGDKQMCCMNPKCWYNHGKGRVALINNKQYYKYNKQ